MWKKPFALYLNVKLFIIFMAIIGIAWLLLSQLTGNYHQETDYRNATTQRSPPNSAKAQVGSDIGKAVNEKSNFTERNSNTLLEQTTYRPGTMRAQRQTPGELRSEANFNRTFNWWVYARSTADANWLDQYGFPTPREEEMLRAASDDELKRLSEKGDVNAKVHIVLKEAKTAFANGDIASANTAANNLEQVVTQGGPYHAISMVKAFGEMLNTFGDSPKAEQTEQRLSILKRIDNLQQQASMVGAAYGDDSIPILKNVFRIDSEREGIGISREVTESMASILAGQARWRKSQSLPPLVLTARPIIPISEPNVIIERY
jgi:hypothetical protein